MAFFSRLFGKGKAPDAAPADADAAPEAPEAPPATVAAPPTHDGFDAGTPMKVPKLRAYEAFNGAVRVLEAPAGKAWEVDEDGRQGQGFLAMSLRFIRPAEPAPMALLAKIYTLIDGTKPNDPAATDWRSAFAPLFASIDRVDVTTTEQLTMESSLPATEVIVEGVSADGGFPLRIRERRAVLGNEEFVVTAMCAISLLERFAGHIDAWFDTVAFVPSPALPAD